jgi:hypothetical protein
MMKISTTKPALIIGGMYATIMMKKSTKLAKIRLVYDKSDGWTRIIRAADMKFQWTRFDSSGNVDTDTRVDRERSAYVLKLDYLDDNDRLRRGTCSLVTPEKGVVDSSIQSADGSTLISYSDIAAVQMKSYEEKIKWFQDSCAQLCVEWNEGHMRMNVRRDYLLSDSIEAVMSLSRKDLRKVWRFEFIGEKGIDDGVGLAREWFELVSEEVFNPDMGLWQPSPMDQTRVQINPASGEYRRIDVLLIFALNNVQSLLTDLIHVNSRNLLSRRSFGLLPLSRTCSGKGSIRSTTYPGTFGQAFILTYTRMACDL